MFKNERFNIKEIASVILEYPRENEVYPYKSNYSSPNPFIFNELFIYLDGKSIYELDGKTFELKKGDIVLIPADISRKKYIVTAIEPVTFVNVYFCCNDIDLTSPKLFRLNSENLSNKFLKLSKIWLSKKENYYLKSMSYLYDIIGDIQHLDGKYIHKKQYEALSESIEYLEANYYKKDFSYTTLSSLSGYSYSYFKKQFIKIFGCSPIKHITNLRINLACELISNDKYKLSDIAEMCGFENSYYFSNTFKKIIGISPLKYKKQKIFNKYNR